MDRIERAKACAAMTVAEVPTEMLKKGGTSQNKGPQYKPQYNIIWVLPPPHHLGLGFVDLSLYFHDAQYSR